MSVEVVERFFAAIEAGDIESVRAIYAPDAVIWQRPAGGAARRHVLAGDRRAGGQDRGVPGLGQPFVDPGRAGGAALGGLADLAQAAGLGAATFGRGGF